MKPLKKEDLHQPGFYLAIGTREASVFCFKVHRDPRGALNIWGLSLWRGRVAYRTHGIPLEVWLAQQRLSGTMRVRFYEDVDREERRKTDE